MFSPGTVQYAFTYFNKYAQESNIFYTTPLFYTSATGNRAGSPEDKVANSFRIVIENVDTTFDHLRIYSIHRTSLDAIATVKIVEDIEIIKNENNDKSISFIDDGTKGDAIEESRLLFIGGEYIVPNCITQKDNTLFLGNILQSDGAIEAEFRKIIKEAELNPSGEYLLTSDNPEIEHPIRINQSLKYEYTPALTKYSGTFKSGEFYKCAIQGQLENGKWTNPVYLGIYQLNERTGDVSNWSPARMSKSINIPSSIKNKLVGIGVKKLRLCISPPRTYERTKICQGILCPTVYSFKLRANNTPHAMSSWFIRPASKNLTNLQQISLDNASNIEFNHNTRLKLSNDTGGEVQFMDDNSVPYIHNFNAYTTQERQNNIEKYGSYFYVDSNIVTFHSPDIEFDENLQNFIWDDVKLRVIGIAPLYGISSDMQITTSSVKALPYVDGTYSKGYSFDSDPAYKANGGLIAGPFYKDAMLQKDESGKVNIGNSVNWMIYPWQRAGSMNNDEVRAESAGAQTSVLDTKKISNLKFFGHALPIKSSNSEDGDLYYYNISTPQLFMSDENSLLKLNISTYSIRNGNTEETIKQVNYLGNVDTVVSRQNYNLYYSPEFYSNPTTKSDLKTSAPIRMKYKSTPHLVFSLKPKKGHELSDGLNVVSILPALDGYKASGNILGEHTQLNPESTGEDTEKMIKIVTSVKDSLDNGTPSDDQKGYYGLWVNDDKKLVVYQATNTAWIPIGDNQLQSLDGTIFTINPDKTCVMSSKLGASDVLILDYIFPGTNSNTDYQRVDSSTQLHVYKGKRRAYKYNISTKTLIESGDLPIIKKPSTITDYTSQLSFSLRNSSDSSIVKQFPSYVLIGELYKDILNDSPNEPSIEEQKALLWVPASDAVSIDSDDETSILFRYGDTFYTRYDCIKTYPFTDKDENQVVEIGSFMVETSVNLDGRYDKNRGLTSNINVSPRNFNLINDVYSQQDNIFQSRILDDDFYKQNKFENQVIWSLPKNPAELVDTWTNIVLSNSISLPGHYGKVTALSCFNENLMCLQDKAVSEILFNSKVQIPVTDGVPIEIGNSYRVDGYRVINSMIGCQDKWSVANAISGLYFIDKYSSTLYSFNGQINNISDSLGMREYFKLFSNNKEWNPVSTDSTLNGIRSFYDKLHGDIYFVPGPEQGENEGRSALCFSEKLGNFSSFMSYQGAVGIEAFNSELVSLCKTNYGSTTPRLYLWQHKENSGAPKKAFNRDLLPSFTFISNDNPTITKIFDNIETRADAITGNDKFNLEEGPIYNLRVSNEYQDTGSSNSDKLKPKYKFRIWRIPIPRNKGTRERIRNPWAKIRVGMSPLAILHDVSVKYTI